MSSRVPITTLSRLPPLTALRAFVATARHLSFNRAALELHVTAAAIGQQIRQLEQHIGSQLFIRNRGELQLTRAGETLMPGLTAAFDTVLESMARLSSAAVCEPVRISAPPSFAGKWLAPRLSRLARFAPDLEVVVEATSDLAELEPGGADCAIRFGAGFYPGLVAERLFAEAVVPVCSQEFAERHGLLSDPSAIERTPLLHEIGIELDPSCPDWRAVLRSLGLPHGAAGSGVRLNQSSLVIDAAAAGQGVGLAKLRLAEPAIAAGQLLVPFGAPRPITFSYSFVTAPAMAGLPQVSRFRDWLLAEAEETRVGALDARPLAQPGDGRLDLAAG